MKKTIYTFLILFFIVLFSYNVQAVNGAEPKGFRDGVNKLVTEVVASDRGLSQLSASEFLIRIINWLLSLVAVLALMSMIIGGILYILSVGDEKKATQAKQAILYAIIGLIVVGLSFAIIFAIETILTGF